MPAFEPDAQIRHYLATGSHDSNYTGWPGNNFVEAAMHASTGFRDVLINEVLTRASSSETRAPFDARTIRDLTRSKVAPMVNGLLPKEEREKVLAIVERSVIFLTSENIVRVLRSECWLHTAWSLANLYLLSVGVDALADDAPSIVGLSQDTTCYVSMAYFDEIDPCVDFIVHEVAHIFHNCKRATVDLPATRRHEWLLDIDFRKRELFAYTCEAYSCILRQGGHTSAGSTRWPGMSKANCRGTRASILVNTWVSSRSPSGLAAAGRSSCVGARRQGRVSRMLFERTRRILEEPSRNCVRI